jgi:hypothetical protein
VCAFNPCVQDEDVAAEDRGAKVLRGAFAVMRIVRRGGIRHRRRVAMNVSGVLLVQGAVAQEGARLFARGGVNQRRRSLRRGRVISVAVPAALLVIDGVQSWNDQRADDVREQRTQTRGPAHKRQAEGRSSAIDEHAASIALRGRNRHRPRALTAPKARPA